MIFSVISAILMGIVPLLNKLGMIDSDPIFTALINSLFALIFCLLNLKHFKNIKLISKPDGPAYAVGIFNAIGLLLMYSGIQFLNPAIYSVTSKSYYLFIMIIGSLYFKETYNKKTWFLFIADIFGIFLLALSDNFKTDISSIGIIFIILSSLFFAFSNIHAKQSKVDSSALIFWNNLITMVIMFIIFIFSIPFHPIPKINFNIIYLIISAFFGSFLAMALYYKSLKLARFTSVTLVRGLSPIITIILTFIFIKTTISIYQWIGIGIVMICSILMTVNENMRKKIKFINLVNKKTSSL